jgi:hypothetical protein
MWLAGPIALSMAADCMFPSDKPECPSPDRRVVLSWSMQPGNWREVTWRQPSSGTSGLVGRFERTVEVFWSPGGHLLGLTDHAGSDNSHALVWSDLATKPRSFEEDLRRVAPADDPLWGNHHQYFDIVKWVGPGRLLIRAWGHGNIQDADVDRLYSWGTDGCGTTGRTDPVTTLKLTPWPGPDY